MSTAGNFYVTITASSQPLRHHYYYQRYKGSTETLVLNPVNVKLTNTKPSVVINAGDPFASHPKPNDMPKSRSDAGTLEALLPEHA